MQSPRAWRQSHGRDSFEVPAVLRARLTNSMAKSAHVFSGLTAICLALALPRCGEPLHTSCCVPPPVLTLVTQGSGTLGAPEANGKTHFLVVPFTASSIGTLNVNVSWTLPSNKVWALLGGGSCTAEQFAVPACPNDPGCPCEFDRRFEPGGGGSVNAMPDGSTAMVFSGGKQPPGTFTLVISNLGPREEMVSYRVEVASVR